MMMTDGVEQTMMMTDETNNICDGSGHVNDPPPGICSPTAGVNLNVGNPFSPHPKKVDLPGGWVPVEPEVESSGGWVPAGPDGDPGCGVVGPVGTPGGGMGHRLVDPGGYLAGTPMLLVWGKRVHMAVVGGGRTWCGRLVPGVADWVESHGPGDWWGLKNRCRICDGYVRRMTRAGVWTDVDLERGGYIRTAGVRRGYVGQWLWPKNGGTSIYPGGPGRRLFVRIDRWETAGGTHWWVAMRPELNRYWADGQWNIPDGVGGPRAVSRRTGHTGRFGFMVAYRLVQRVHRMWFRDWKLEIEPSVMEDLRWYQKQQEQGG